MGGKPTRVTFATRKKVTGVVVQQGRVQADEDQNLAQMILDYLVKYPQAQDTLEGIVQWWLLNERLTVVTANVKEALDELIRDGLVNCRCGVNGRTYYSLDRRKMSAALNRLSSLRKPRKRKRKRP